jgi:nitrite reductase/ring-hydroxylating ferredoxin subunit
MKETTYIPVVALADVREGFVANHEIEGRQVIVARTASGVFVYDATCPHADFQFGSARLRGGCEIECQMHGARFAADDQGSVIKGPAKEPLWVLESHVSDDGMVMVAYDW